MRRRLRGGPLALLDNGDLVSLDVERREVNLEVPREELERRRSQPRRFGAQGEGGYLGIYQRLVRPVHKGATLVG